jgi:20S proteasome alpha/beta subunit
MTVGIAALCEDGKAAVLAADRGIVFGEEGLRSERDSPKITFPDDKNLLVYSGNFPDLEFIMRRLPKLVDGQFPDVISRLSEACEERCKDLRNRELRKIGASLEQLGAAALAQERKPAIVAEIQSKAFQGAFLIAGTDSETTYIYTINHNPPNPHHVTGYHAIGTGANACLPVLTARGMNRSLTLEQAAYLAYEAKRVSEACYGIGPKTDIAVVGVGLPAQFLAEPAIDKFRDIYERRNRLDELGLGRIVELDRDSNGSLKVADLDYKSPLANGS